MAELLRLPDAVFLPYAIAGAASQQIGSSNRGGILGGMFTTALFATSTMLLYDASSPNGTPIWTHDDSQLIGSQLNVRFSNGLFVVITGLAKFTFIVAFE